MESAIFTTTSNESVGTMTRAESIERLYELFDIPVHGDNVSRTSTQVGRAVRPPFSTPNLDFDDDEYQNAFEEVEYKRGVGPQPQLGMNSSATPSVETKKRGRRVKKEVSHMFQVDYHSASSLRMRYPGDSFTPLVRLLVVQIPEADSRKRLFDWIYKVRQEYKHVTHSQYPKTYAPPK